MTATDASFSAERVIVDWPAPVAIAYRRMLRHADARGRLDAIWATGEMLVRYLVLLLVAAKVASAPEVSPAWLAKLFRPGRPLSLGQWIEVLREVGVSCPRHVAPTIFELATLVRADGAFMRDLGELVALRNQIAHPDGAIAHTLDEHSAAAGGARTILDRLLCAAEPITRLPLGIATQPRLRGSPSTRRWLHGCMGARVEPTEHAIVVDLDAEEDLLGARDGVAFVVALEDGGRGSVLELGGLLHQEVSALSGRHTLYVPDGVESTGDPWRLTYSAIDVREKIVRPFVPQSVRQVHTSRAHELAARLGAGPHSTLTERNLGRFRLTKRIASGGSGTVYGAVDLEGVSSANGQQPSGHVEPKVAIKVLEARHARTHLARFAREARELSRSAHPSIVPILGFGTDVIDGREVPWYAMPLAAGGDLAGRIDDRGVDPWRDARTRSEVIAEWVEVVSAVAHLHSLGLVHRDIKPANVLVFEHGRVCLSDFGLVKEVVGGVDETATSTGAVLGTPLFMAPEQARGEAVDARADVYALGVLLATLATGERPVVDLRRPQGSAIGSWKAVVALPNDIRRLILTSTDVDPSLRPPEASALLELAKRSLKGAVEAAPKSRPGRRDVRGRSPSPRPGSHHLRAAALPMLGAVVVVGALGHWYARAHSSTDHGCPEGMRRVTGGRWVSAAGVFEVSALCVDTTEVTVEAYARCMHQGLCSPHDLDDPRQLTFCNAEWPDRGRHPMNCVDALQAEAYCRYRDARLPTDWEWSWIAQGGSRATSYPWGNELPSVGHACWSGTRLPYPREGTCEVGAFSQGATPAGIQDLSGNLYEWTASTDADGLRIMRGGSYLVQSSTLLRADERRSGNPGGRDRFLGFRCVR